MKEAPFHNLYYSCVKNTNSPITSWSEINSLKKIKNMSIKKQRHTIKRFFHCYDDKLVQFEARPVSTAIVSISPCFRPRSLIVPLLSLSFLGFCQTATATDPAVSDLNFKLGAQGGSLAGLGSGLGFGSFTAPLGHSFGLQVDGGAGSVDSKAYWGTGSHLFWRDPSIGLLGLTYSYQRLNDVNFGYINNSNTSVVKDAYMHNVGLEGDAYLSRFTVGGLGGYQGGTVNSDGYGQLKLRYYATDNWSVQAIGDHFAGQNLIRGGIEYKPNFEVLSGLSLFAEGGYGTHDYGMGQAGIRYYFGKQASLIDIDRRSDPQWTNYNSFFQQIYSVTHQVNYPVPVIPPTPPQ